MGKYVANPVEIEAYEIMSVSPACDNGRVGKPWTVYVQERGWIALDGHMDNREPRVGDYLIFRSAEDIYVCPKEVFEEKYSPKAVVRLTREDIEAKISSVLYSQPADTLTVCVLTLENGFHVVGKSACIDPAGFDEQKGREIAYEDALRQVWQLEGYLATEKMHRERIGCDCAGRYHCGCEE